MRHAEAEAEGKAKAKLIVEEGKDETKTKMG